GGLHLRELDDFDLFFRARRGLTFLASRGCRWRGSGLALAALGRGLDVFLRNSPARAAALHLAQVDTVLFREAPGDGGHPLSFPVFRGGGAPDRAQRRLPCRPDFGSVVRTAVGILLTAAVRRLLGGFRHRLIGLLDVGLWPAGMRFWGVGGGSLRLRLGFCRGSLALGLGGFLGLFFGPGRFLSLLRRPTIPPDFGDHGSDGGALAFGDDALAQLAGGVGLHLDVGLVALDLDQWLALFDLLAFFLQPAQDLAGFHRVRQAGHLDVGHSAS